MIGGKHLQRIQYFIALICSPDRSSQRLPRRYLPSSAPPICGPRQDMSHPQIPLWHHGGGFPPCVILRRARDPVVVLHRLVGRDPIRSPRGMRSNAISRPLQGRLVVSNVSLGAMSGRALGRALWLSSPYWGYQGGGWCSAGIPQPCLPCLALAGARQYAANSGLRRALDNSYTFSLPISDTRTVPCSCSSTPRVGYRVSYIRHLFRESPTRAPLSPHRAHQSAG